MSEQSTTASISASSSSSFPQRAVVLGASGYASELAVDPSPLNALLDEGWSFLCATPINVDVSGAGNTGVVYGAASVLVIVEWRRNDPPRQTTTTPSHVEEKRNNG